MRVAKAIIRYNVSKVLMTLSSFLIDRKLRTAKVRLMPFYHIRYPAHKKRAAFGPPFLFWPGPDLAKAIALARSNMGWRLNL